MKKYLIISFIFLNTALSAQVAVTSQGYERLPDVRLNETQTRRSVFDFVIPAEVAQASRLCANTAFQSCIDDLEDITKSNPDPKIGASAQTEIAFTYYNLGIYDKALTHITKASSLNPEDPFPLLSKAWFLITTGEYKEAQSQLDALLYLTGDFEYISAKNLAAAFISHLEGDNKEQEHFAHIYTANPYLISLASYMIALESYNIGNTKNLNAADIFLQQSLSHDEHNFPAAQLFAKVKDKRKDYNTAWQYYAMLYARDNTDTKSLKRVQKLGKKDLKNKSLFIYTLNQPIVRNYKSIPGPEVKMMLYARADMTPTYLQSFEVVSTAPMSIVDEKLGEVFKTNPLLAESVTFDNQFKSLIIKDRHGKTKFATKRPLTIVPHTGYTVLVKNAKSNNIFEADFSDKELKGTITVNTSDKGFNLINNVTIEDILPSLLASESRAIQHTPQTLKAFAIAVRTYLYKETAEDGLYHISDSEPSLKFGGVNMESGVAKKAAADTLGMVLDDNNDDFYSSCFIYGANGVKNSASAGDFAYSPSNVFKYIISNPPADLLSAPADDSAWAPLKWAYLYDTKDIARRIKASFKDIGALTGIKILETDFLGHVKTMKFEGTKDSVTITEAKQISFVLSAGSIRSNLFQLIPFYKGAKIKSILALGVDSGLGSGLCLNGAQGLEKEAKDFNEILKFYYPEVTLKTVLPALVEDHEDEPADTGELLTLPDANEKTPEI
ncbi:SpoIID/LytB domain protein [Elusimicrobium simillimum]|uniref:SpoIID/LytB domain-containing protein n=1 Tax=Elusimicrobium simillimum TaxID=3143438 RepID=UPI003C6F45C8